MLCHPQILNEGEGNVHSGATPPWLQVDNDSEMCEGVAPVQLGPSEEEFLCHSKWHGLISTVLNISTSLKNTCTFTVSMT